MPCIIDCYQETLDDCHLYIVKGAMVVVVVVFMFHVVAWVVYKLYYYLEVKNERSHHRTLGGVWSMGVA